eukprot:440833-Prymnesium_polylepis.1
MVCCAKVERRALLEDVQRRVRGDQQPAAHRNVAAQLLWPITRANAHESRLGSQREGGVHALIVVR